MRYVIITFTLVIGILFQINTARAYTRTPSGLVSNSTYDFSFTASDLCNTSTNASWAIEYTDWNGAVYPLLAPTITQANVNTYIATIDYTNAQIQIPSTNYLMRLQGWDDNCFTVLEGNGADPNFYIISPPPIPPTPDPNASSTSAITSLFTVFYDNVSGNIYFIFGSLIVVGILLWTLREIERYLR